MRIIAAIDIIDGKCVRLSQGDYSKMTVYNEDPLEVAKSFEDHGIQYLHVVDLDGAKSHHIVNHKTLHRIANSTSLKIDFGGGVKTHDDVRVAFENGANQITGGSIAATQPETFLSWVAQYGAEKIILGADCSNRKIAVNGWQDQLELDVVEFISDYAQKGIAQVICTDVAKDGMLAGTSNALYEEIISKVNVKLIASGGVSSLADLHLLKQIGCEGAIVGKAIYEGKITLQQIEELC